MPTWQACMCRSGRTDPGRGQTRLWEGGCIWLVRGGRTGSTMVAGSNITGERTIMELKITMIVTPRKDPARGGIITELEIAMIAIQTLPHAKTQRLVKASPITLTHTHRIASALPSIVRSSAFYSTFPSPLHLPQRLQLHGGASRRDISAEEKLAEQKHAICCQ